MSSTRRALGTERQVRRTGGEALAGRRSERTRRAGALAAVSATFALVATFVGVVPDEASQSLALGPAQAQAVDAPAPAPAGSAQTRTTQSGTAQPGTTQSRTAWTRPNIVLIATDDMAKTDLRWMPETRRLLESAGVELGDFISNHPLCCPARAEILTGQYGHNNGVHDNGGRWGGYPALGDPGNHVGTWLKAAGYKTAFVGKHMNRWEIRARHQRGWTVFDPILKGVYSPSDLTMFNNGRPRLYPGIHTSDLVGRLSIKYINRFSRSGSPFFVWVSQVAPHGMLVDGQWGNPVPAPRHSTLYPDAVPPSLSDPSFNESDTSDKPLWIQRSWPLSTQKVIESHLARIRSLRSVDDQVAATVRALRENGELRNTYIFFTSDNGYLLGEHRLQNKNKPYEQSLQLPLLVRGPGLARGITREHTYSLVDLAPTFVQLAGATPRRRLDGRSMMPTLRRGAPGYSHYLIQAALGFDSKSTGPYDGGNLEWWWRGVRSSKHVYLRYNDGFEELYDMTRDPAQLHNVAGDPAYSDVQAEYTRRLARLVSCVGEACQRGGSARGGTRP